MSLLELRDVSVRYDDFVALEQVNLTVYDGDFMGIIGPNGGGKTTLIKAILGDVAHSGTIQYSDALGKGKSRRIGYMPQVSQFDRKFPISVQDVVMSGLQSRKHLFARYGADDRAAAMALMHKTGIDGIAKYQIAEISGGQLQRALLCRAIIAEPKLLILDEPTNFVDNNFENELYTLLRQLNERMAIVMISHDLGTISSVVKSIVCVNHYVHRHDSNVITSEQLENYHCPIQLISHGEVPHSVLEFHHHTK